MPLRDLNASPIQAANQTAFFAVHNEADWGSSGGASQIRASQRLISRPHLAPPICTAFAQRVDSTTRSQDPGTQCTNGDMDWDSRTNSIAEWLDWAAGGGTDAATVRMWSPVRGTIPGGLMQVRGPSGDTATGRPLGRSSFAHCLSTRSQRARIQQKFVSPTLYSWPLCPWA